jgi:G:T-mismatch repair DNA endonuclease (very short patch repair protein)
MKETSGGIISLQTCKMPIPGKRLSLSEFKDAVELVQPGKIDLSLVTEYKNAHKHVKCICISCNWEWPAKPMHLMKKGKPTSCPKCAGKEYTQADFILLSEKKYGKDVFKYDYVVFVNMKTPVILICSYGHQFKVSPDVHLRPESLGGCKECQWQSCSVRMSYTQGEWIELARIKHDKYYSYERTEYKGSYHKVIITCPSHGDFEQLPTSHLMGAGCPLCGFESIAQSKFLTDEDISAIFAKARNIHSGRYEYTRIFRIEGRLYIEMRCTKHDVISQRLDHHLHDHGCMLCTHQYSKEQLESLTYYSITRYRGMLHAENGGEYKIPDTKYKADGFHTETNTILEHHGDFWHGGNEYNPLEINPRTGTTYGLLRERTKIKEDVINALGYKLIVIWGSEWLRGKKAVFNIQRAWKVRRMIIA